MFKNIIIIVLTGIVLHLTVPDDRDFKEFYSDKIEKQQEDTSTINKVILGTKGLNAKMNVKSEYKVIYSVYTVNFMGKEERYLGIAKHFINIEKAKESAAKVKDGLTKEAKEIKEKIDER